MIVSRKIADMFKYPGFVNIDYLIENKLEADPSKILNILNRDWRKWVKPLCMLDGGGLDPAFGYETPGASSSYIFANYLYGSKFTAPSDVLKAVSITMYCQPINPNQDVLVKAVLVNSTKQIVAVSNPVNIRYAGISWQTFRFPTLVDLIPNADYYLMGISAYYWYLYYDSGGTSLKDTSNSYTTPTDPTDGSVGTEEYSIYCTYTAPVKRGLFKGLFPRVIGKK
jgi:hypothetical protein